jgi:hypothetical protein
MNAGIANTLRDKLFDHPAPAHRETEFSALTIEMFPARSLFLSFLEEHHFERQVEAAKHILLRLSYQSCISPPNKYLYNLLDTESYLAGTASKNSFNGRDHFVHIVNLYLLGLYLFWYHSQIHKRMCDQFSEPTQNADDPSKQTRHISACRNFLSAWREFVLFHDLGYPWEVSAGMVESPKFLAPFGDLIRYLAKDSALFVISQVMALEWMRKYDPPVLLANDRSYLFKSNSRQATLYEDEVRKEWGTFEKIPSTIDLGLWRLTCEIVPHADRLSILETTVEGRPVASTNSELHREIQRRLKRPREAAEDELNDVDKLNRWAMGETVSTRLSAQYQWVHYCRNYQDHFAAFCQRLFPNMVEAATNFTKFVDDYLDEFSPARAISDEPQFDDCAFAMYLRLLDSLDFDTYDQFRHKRLIIHDAICQSELVGLKGRLLSDVFAGLLPLLENQANALKEDKESDIPNAILGDYLHRLLSVLQDTDKLVAEVDKHLSPQLKKRIALKGQLFEFYDSIKSGVLAITDNSIPDVFVEDKNEIGSRGKFKVNWQGFENNFLAKDLNDMLASHRLEGLATLESYTPIWAPARSSNLVFEDHGVVSGLLYAQTTQAWCAAYSRVDSLLGRLLKLRVPISHNISTTPNGHSTVEAVSYSIFLHNLYPKSFKNSEQEKFRTKFARKEAFTYFAMLCDSLQPWDRKRLFNQSTGNLHYSTYAENFDIEVDGTTLIISEKGDQLRIEERLASLRSHLDSFLENASDMIKLHLSEHR